MVIQKLLVEEGMKRGLKASRQYSVSVLGYDFIGLIMRLAVFYFAAFVINSYFIATIKGNIWLNTFMGLLGSKPFPQTLPQWVIDLFTVGIGSKGFTISETPTAEGKFNPSGWSESYDYGSLQHQQIDPEMAPPISRAGFTVNFWQIIQVISILLVIVEYTQYERKLKEESNKPNVTTIAVFAMIGLSLSLMVFPQIINKIKEMRILNES